MKSDMTTVLTMIHQSLPPFFTRDVAADKLGGLLGAKSLANIDCRGQGPGTKVRMGKKVLYERENFVDWLKQYYKLE